MDDQVFAPWQRGQQRRVCGKAGGEIKRRLGAEERGRFRFQRFMLRMVATQQARAARPQRHAAFQRRHCRAAQGIAFRQPPDSRCW